MVKTGFCQRGLRPTKKRCTSSTAKRQQQQALCGKAIKVAGNEARNMAVNVKGIKKNLVTVKGPHSPSGNEWPNSELRGEVDSIQTSLKPLFTL